jgi:hypothetical protein
MFGLLAGAGGLQISRVDLNSIMSIKLNNLLSGTVLMLCLMSLFGSGVGIAFRNGRFKLPWDARGGESLSAIRNAAAQRTITVSDLVSASVFDSKLRAAAVDEDTRQQILNLILTEARSHKGLINIREQAKGLDTTWKRVVSSLDVAFARKPMLSDSRIFDVPTAVQHLRYLVNAYETQLQELLQVPGDIPLSAYKEIVNSGLQAVQAFLDASESKDFSDRENFDWLITAHFNLSSLLSLHRALLDAQSQLAQPGWTSDKPVSQDLNDYVAKVLGAKDVPLIVAKPTSEALANNSDQILIPDRLIQ